MGDRGPDIAAGLADPPISEARSGTLLSAATTDVWWADGAGRLLADLPGWRAHTGQGLDELLGDGWLGAVRHDRRGALEAARRHAVASASRFDADFQIVSPTGRERTVSRRARSVSGPGGPQERCGAWVTLACAGHPRPVVVRRAGWIDLRGQPGTLVGIFPDLDVTEDRVGLGPGDALVFFTDGISEARDKRVWFELPAPAPRS